MAIADVYDALVSPRQYKKAFTADEAVNIMKDGIGIHFDPVLTDVFIDISGKFEEISKIFLENEDESAAVGKATL